MPSETIANFDGNLEKIRNISANQRSVIFSAHVIRQGNTSNSKFEAVHKTCWKIFAENNVMVYLTLKYKQFRAHENRKLYKIIIFCTSNCMFLRATGDK